MTERDEILVSDLHIEDLTPAEREALAEAGRIALSILDNDAE